jgi:hypothetical protein
MACKSFTFSGADLLRASVAESSTPPVDCAMPTHATTSSATNNRDMIQVGQMPAGFVPMPSLRVGFAQYANFHERDNDNSHVFSVLHR